MKVNGTEERRCSNRGGDTANSRTARRVRERGEDVIKVKSSTK